MTNLRVDSVLCHAALDVDLEPGVTLITGVNSSGKTSIARILAALTAHDENPAHISVGNKKAYVQDGSLEGQARLGEVVWRPPGGISSPVGQEPMAVPHAVGLIDFVRGNRPVKQRAELWEGLFMPDDPAAILKPRWTLPEAQLAAVLEIIGKEGWDAAASIYEQKRVEAKRRWRDITGAGAYGASKAAAWVPKDWRAELEGASKDELQAECVDLRDRLQALSTRQAVEQNQIDEARRIRDEEIPLVESRVAALYEAWEVRKQHWEEARRQHEESKQGLQRLERELKAELDRRARESQIPDLESMLSGYDADYADLEGKAKSIGAKLGDVRERLRQASEELSGTRQKLDAAQAGVKHDCPHCGEALEISGNSIVAWRGASPEEVERMEGAHAEVAAAVEGLKTEQAELVDGERHLAKALANLLTKRSELRGQLELLQKQGAEMGTAEPGDPESLQQAIAEKRAEIEELTFRYAETGRLMEEARRQHDVTAGSLNPLYEQAALADAEPSPNDEAARARLQAELEEANKAVAAHEQWTQAKREHDNVIVLDNVCKLLGPTGARAEHMRGRMDDVRGVMRNACAVSGWADISILDDYSLTSAGRPIALAADNERLKAQYLCQAACAMLSGSEWLVLDQADLLRDESWTGLVDLLARIAKARDGESSPWPALHVVVCATSTPCPEGWAHVRLGD